MIAGFGCYVGGQKDEGIIFQEMHISGRRC